MTPMALMLALVACKKDEVPTDDTSDTQDTAVNTDDSADTQDTGEPCTAKPSEFRPREDSTSHYYRDPVTVAFTQPVPGAEFTLTQVDPEAEVALTVEWADTMDRVTLSPDPAFPGNASFSLDVTVCGATYTHAFGTSELGVPMEIPPEDVIGRVYAFELSEVDYVKPESVSGLVSTLLDLPVLIQPTALHEGNMTLLGSQGWVNNEGKYVQKERFKYEGENYWVPTFDFEDVDFSAPPFYQGDSPEMVLVYEGVTISVYDFHLEGTFSADASYYGGGRIWGDVDTRNTAPLLESDDPNAFCDLLAGFGGACEACPDGEVYCFELEAENVTAVYVDYLTLVPHEFEPR